MCVLEVIAQMPIQGRYTMIPSKSLSVVKPQAPNALDRREAELVRDFQAGAVWRHAWPHLQATPP